MAREGYIALPSLHRTVPFAPSNRRRTAETTLHLIPPIRRVLAALFVLLAIAAVLVAPGGSAPAGANGGDRLLRVRATI
jgi:hypothetical protein